MKILEHWKEYTRVTSVKPRKDVTLAMLSFMLGETITEQISHGATEFTVEVSKTHITIACNKGGLEKPTGYDPNRLYKSLFK